MTTAGRPRRPFRPHRQALAAAGVVVSLCASGALALTEPDERELRQAYLHYLEQFVTAQGELIDPYCSLAGKGCSVRLLDTRRDYRFVALKKTACRPAPGTAFVCSFRATVTCAYHSAGRLAPEVADLYCGPLFNKESTYTALLEYLSEGWEIVQFVQG